MPFYKNIYYADTSTAMSAAAISAAEATSVGDAFENLETSVNTGYRLNQILTLTSSTTFYKASYTWLRAIRVICVGGGGASGAAVGAASGQSNGGGGGGGAYAESFITDIAGLGSSITVTVGAGGTGTATNGNDGSDSSFGSLVVAAGGKGGASMTSTAGTSSAASGVGGLASSCTGDMKIDGGDGSNGRVTSGIAMLTCDGGASLLSGTTRTRTNSGIGLTGHSYGGGASGANATTATFNGGAGGAGVVIVELYA